MPQGEQNAEPRLSAAIRLHGWISRHLLVHGLLVGPDPGIRWNARFGRFVKSYGRRFFRSERLTYIQAQAYWILANFRLSDLLNDPSYSRAALAGARKTLLLQRPEGFWDYPNPEWHDRIATVEGCFGALALTETYRRTGDGKFLAASAKWYDFMIDHIGFSNLNDSSVKSINYFAGWDRAVPNNDTLVLWMASDLANASGSRRFLEHLGPIVAWLSKVQLDTGELPYLIGTRGQPDRRHFLCYQYNAFEFVDLARYYWLTGDPEVYPIMERLIGYLATGLDDSGWARFDCDVDYIRVPYYTSALGNAFSIATALDLGDYSTYESQSFETILGLQRNDGSFPFFSQGNYRVLTDRRHYPRYLAMILDHLLTPYPMGAR
jgi:hypothetical protein